MSSEKVFVAEESSREYLWSAVFLLLAGVLCVAMPLAAGLAAMPVVAGLMVLAGVAHLVLGWRLRFFAGSGTQFLLGVIYLAGGVLLFLHPFTGLATVTTIYAIVLFASGVAEVLAYFSLRLVGASAWFLVGGGLSVLLGVLVMRHLPSAAEWLPGTLYGCSLLSGGLTRLMIYRHRHALETHTL